MSARELPKTQDVLNGKVIFAADVPEDGGKMPMECVNLLVTNVLPGMNKLVNV
jgi:hypothetical protein